MDDDTCFDAVSVAGSGWFAAAAVGDDAYVAAVCREVGAGCLVGWGRFPVYRGAGGVGVFCVGSDVYIHCRKQNFEQKGDGLLALGVRYVF